MKKLSILALAAVGLFTSACTSSDVADTGNQDPFKGREGGFIKVGINLPVQPQVSTRAWQESATGTLDDGLAKEYKVKSCILLLFEGSDEASATLKQVAQISETPKSLDDDPNQVTTYITETVELESAPTANLYALAVVNGDPIIKMASTTSVNILGGAAQSGIKLGDLTAATANFNAGQWFINTIDGESDCFFMTNAVLDEEQGGTVEPSGAGKLHTLALVDASRIYETEEEAKKESSDPSCDIYVERGVAKVTIDNSDANYLSVTSLKTGDGTALTGSATLKGWAIDNTNVTSYVVRNPSPFSGWGLVSFAAAASVDKYRFVGANPVDGGHTKKVGNPGYRTYWCIDPNYGIDWALGLYRTTPDGEYSDAVGENAPQYCFENTFDVAHQVHKHTTRVVFKVQLSSGDFYTVGADKKTLFSLDDVKKKFATALLAEPAFTSWFATEGGSGTLSYDKMTLDVTKNTYNRITVNKVEIDGSLFSGAAKTFDDATTIATVNAKVGKVMLYEGGMAYYQARIKHFGDDLTPWNNGEYLTAPKESGIDDIYPNDVRRNANYLGRYGMVRNNWYVILPGAIAKIGSATVPEVNRDKPTTPDPDDPENPDHPDDELEDAYIKARINILSWAKRPQSWNLK